MPGHEVPSVFGKWKYVIVDIESNGHGKNNEIGCYYEENLCSGGLFFTIKMTNFIAHKTSDALSTLLDIFLCDFL